MRKLSRLLSYFQDYSFTQKSFAQIDLNNIDIKDIIGKVMHVEKGFAPKFSLGKTPIEKINKVAEILGLKKNEVNRLFNTFKTGRTFIKLRLMQVAQLQYMELQENRKFCKK